MPVSLCAQSIRKTFPTRSGELVVLRDVSLSLGHRRVSRHHRALRLGKEHAAQHLGHARRADRRQSHHRRTRPVRPFQRQS